MDNSNFDESTQSLWIPTIKNNKLCLTNKYGDEKESSAENSLIYENNLGHTNDKYDHLIYAAAFNPVNPIQYIETGCSNCKSKYLKYIRIGETQEVIYVCSCSGTVKQ